jgi:hypothetical protein
MRFAEQSSLVVVATLVHFDLFRFPDLFVEKVFMFNLLLKSHLCLPKMLLSRQPLSKIQMLVQVLSVIGFASLVFACQSTPKEEVPVAPLLQQVPAPVELTPQQKVVDRLLSEADYCLSQNKLLNPITDNAHDRYRSVLLMDPQNERAKLGLQTISMRYVELARTAAKRGNLSEAQTHIRYARSIDNNPVVQDAAETLRKQVASTPPPKPYQAAEGEVVLDAKLLQAKDAQITSQLTAVAKKAKDTDQFVLIIARTDAEGRWVYQQLRNAVPGYLVRGDIKLGSPTRVKLVKSLD